MISTRRMARKDYVEPIRISMLEDDADALEAFTKSLSETVSKEMVALRNRLTGILIAVTTGSIMLTVNAILLGRQ